MTVKELRKALKKYPPDFDISFQYYESNENGWDADLLPLQLNGFSVTFALVPTDLFKQPRK